MILAINAINRLSLRDLTIASPDVANKCRTKVSDCLLGRQHYPLFIYYSETASRRHRHPPSWSFSRASWAEFSRIDDEKLAELSEADAETTNEEFAKGLISTASLTISCTKPCAKAPVPWWTTECKTTIRQKERLKRK